MINFLMASVTSIKHLLSHNRSLIGRGRVMSIGV